VPLKRGAALVATVAYAAVACAACGDGNRAPAGTRETSTSSSTSSTSTTSTTTPPTTAPAPPPPAPAPTFGFAVAAVDGAVRDRVEGSSWRPGCPVPMEQLRYLTLSHWGFDGGVHQGELVVHEDSVDAMRSVFGRLFAAGFPIRSMRLVDDFGADDYASIEADNTSAFNCRERTGGGGWSQHAYGRAIDVNPIENPYVDGGSTSHPASQPYLDRSSYRPGMAVAGGELVAAFAAAGWGWGGTWSGPVDHQHFSATGR
jgi:poly-gamma-glutamate synthesis protein (capsule biosynthesis protein)